MSILNDLNRLKNQKTQAAPGDSFGRGILTDINVLKTRRPVQSEFSPKEQEAVDLIDGIVPEEQRQGFLSKLFERGKYQAPRFKEEKQPVERGKYQAPQFKEKAKPMEFKVGEGLEDEGTILRPGPTKRLEGISKLPGFKPEDIKFELEAPERISLRLAAEKAVRRPVEAIGPKITAPDQDKVRGVVNAIPKFIKDVVVTYPVRFATSVGIDWAADVMELATGRDIERAYQPGGKIEKFLLGEEPIESFTTRSQVGYAKASDIGKALGLDEEQRQLLGGVGLIAPMLLGMIDMVPIINPRNVGRAILKESPKIAALKESDKILKILKKFVTGADDELKVVAEYLTKIDNPKEVEKTLTGLYEMAKAPDKKQKLAEAVLGTTKGAEPTIISKELEPLARETQILRGTKGMTAEDIMKTYPDIRLKRDVPATDIYGNKVKVPEGEVLTPYELKGNKILLQDGETYVVSKNQFENIKGQAISKEVKEFAPGLKGMEEVVKEATPIVEVKKVSRGWETYMDGKLKGTILRPGLTKTEALKIAKGAIKKIKPLKEIKKLTIKEAGDIERKFITSVKEKISPAIKVAGRYVPRDTDELAIKARNLIKDDVVLAERLALTGTDDKAVATASGLIKHYAELAQKATGAEQIAFYDKAADIANEIAPKLTEQGRAIQAASILGRLTPEGMVRFAAKEIQKYNRGVERDLLKIPELTGEQAGDILRKAKEIEIMADGVEKAMAFQKLQNEVFDLIPSSIPQKLITLWKAGLLTGLKTSGLNTSSNLFHGVSEIIKDIPAVAVDKVTSLFTKERTLALTIQGVAGGASEGFGKGIRYMRTGFDERNIGAKLDWKRVNFGKSKIAKGLQTYEELIFHWMGAQDQPFYYGAKARSLASQAIAQGKTKGLKGDELKKFVQTIIESPTDDMLRYAVNDAEMSVFQNRTLLGAVARKLQQVPFGEVVVPFGRTPSAVATQVINYSPVGIVKTIVKNIGKGNFDQRLFSQGIGRGMTGTAAMFIGMELYKKKLIELDYPISEREKKQWELEGRKPTAFKTSDGKWRSLMVLGPLGLTVMIGGNLRRALDNNGSFSASLAEAAAASYRGFTDQTFLTSLKRFSEAVTDPQRYAFSTAGSLVGSVVPTIVSDIARATDQFERRTAARTEGLRAGFLGRIPGVRQLLEKRVDVFGNFIERGGNAMETMLDPTRPTKIKSNELIEELRRLFEAGYSATPTEFADEKKYIEILTPQQITRIKEKAGVMLEDKLLKLINNADYQEMSDDEKKKIIDKFTDKSRELARAEMTQELTQGLKGEDLKNKLSELKQSGFLTKGVYEEWDRLFQ